ncbi:MAG: DUF5009 domain-containing protein [Massilibacteroides sp.]|nr:DUF5009 domain-containing protein [Massilibacteroides sp.]MDD3062005.1 DUF5009 domain-containing protein [Massilibacteroides sp.]MDD4114060.1 DUF5009 domain-containing protein [Massilibacteroides sp.]MDD4659278.1 DUF5009 domain-containing protein [Massilibacteroides sp.]
MKTQEKKNARLMSLDALRGFDMFFIMGFAGLIVALCNLFPDSVFMSGLGNQMSHVKWDGLTHHDTIFPLFLFIAGISFPFSLEKQRSSGKSEKDIYSKIIKRGLTLVLLGFVYNGIFNLDFENMRYASVLGRIGLAWMFAALLFVKCNTKTNVLISFILLVGYWLAMWLIPNSATPFSFDNNLVGVVDRMLLPGHLNEGTFDPEGILSTIPAIATALLGMFTGQLVKLPNDKCPQKKKVLYMVLAAIAFLLIGWLWSFVFPINKKLWSSSFVCVLVSYSLFLFALFYYIIDVKGHNRYSLFFRVVGLNSITIYLGQQIVDFGKITEFFLGGILSHCPEGIGAVITNVGYFTVCWLFVYFLYKQKIFLKV